VLLRARPLSLATSQAGQAQDAQKQHVLTVNPNIQRGQKKEATEATIAIGKPSGF
jgi:hypothetical protein